MSGIKAYQKVTLQEQALTPQQRMTLQTLFKKYDKDNSGALDKTEFRALLEDSLNKKLSDLLFNKYLELQFNSSDKDFNGTIDFAEFASLYSKIYTNPELPISMGYAEVKKATKLETGVNSPKVEKRPDLQLTPEEIADANAKFKQFDKDGNGQIDKTELKDLLLATSAGKKMSPTMVERYVGVQFSLWDKDHSGFIDSNEFLAVYAKFWSESQKPSLF